MSETKQCRVKISDIDGVCHIVNVAASSLYEAVALGLKAVRGSEWVDAIPDGRNTVSVAVHNPEVEHCVTVRESKKWLDGSSRSPAEVMRRKRIKEILGLLE